MGKMPEAPAEPVGGNHHIFLPGTLEIRKLFFRQGVEKTLPKDHQSPTQLCRSAGHPSRVSPIGAEVGSQEARSPSFNSRSSARS
jgi:hypothetical protein